MDYNENIMAYSATDIPVVPYRNDGAYIPFPVIYIEAKDAQIRANTLLNRNFCPGID